MADITKFKEYLAAKGALSKYCKDKPDNQRDTLYDWLDNELDITIDRSVYDYSDKTSNHARFACDDPKEVAVVMERIIRELKKK